MTEAHVPHFSVSLSSTKLTADADQSLTHMCLSVILVSCTIGLHDMTYMYYLYQ